MELLDAFALSLAISCTIVGLLAIWAHFAEDPAEISTKRRK